MKWQNLRTQIWIAVRALKAGRKNVGVSALFSLLGLVLGVASLVVAMAVMSGFELALSRALVDVTGDLRLFQRAAGRFTEPWEELIEKAKKAEPRIVDGARFTILEGVAASKGRLSGVMVQGVDEAKINSVLNIKGRIIEGALEVRKKTEDDETPALVGKGLLKNLNLKVGDTFKVVVPVADDLAPSRFSRKLATFRVAAALDLGKHDFDERWIVTGLEAAQTLSAIGDGYSGLILKTTNSLDARGMAFRLNHELGAPYWVKDWRQLNENLLEAVKIEKFVIFFILLIILVAAAFNVSSTLFINVVNKYSLISILKTVGATPQFILRVFSFQGLMIGAIGLFFGIIIGLLLCFAFTFVQEQFSFLPGDVYHVDGFGASLQWMDLLVISIATLTICFVSTLAPAMRGARLSPVEGLRYE
ncbi:MAG: FtsX-like permease family protein [Pseudobdellovibrionaceae bacterium]